MTVAFEVETTEGINLEVVRQWAEALESGEYAQTGGTLSEAGKFCCLGVLCELAVANGVIPAPEVILNPDGDPTDGFSYQGSQAFLPRVVSEWAFGDSIPQEESHNPKLNFTNPDAEGGPEFYAAADLNDVFHLGFPKIAACIRDTFEL